MLLSWSSPGGEDSSNSCSPTLPQTGDCLVWRGGRGLCPIAPFPSQTSPEGRGATAAAPWLFSKTCRPQFLEEPGALPAPPGFPFLTLQTSRGQELVSKKLSPSLKLHLCYPAGHQGWGLPETPAREAIPTPVHGPVGLKCYICCPAGQNMMQFKKLSTALLPWASGFKSRHMQSIWIVHKGFLFTAYPLPRQGERQAVSEGLP